MVCFSIVVVVVVFVAASGKLELRTCKAQFAGAPRKWFGNLFGSNEINGTANLFNAHVD